MDGGAEPGDWLAQADDLLEGAVFSGSESAVEAAKAALDQAEVALLLGRGRALHVGQLARLRAGQQPDQAEVAQALGYFDRAYEIAQASTDLVLRAKAGFWCAVGRQVLVRDHEAAEPILRDVYRLARQLGQRKLMSYALRHIGSARHAAGDRDAAWQALSESADLRRQIDFRPGLAAALHAMGRVGLEYGRRDACDLLREASALATSEGAVALLEDIRRDLERCS